MTALTHDGYWVGEDCAHPETVGCQTCAPARPADLMRQAAREESTETLRQLGGIAALHGFTFHAATTWFVCFCANGMHDGDRVMQRYEARDEADARRWQGPGHVIAEDTVTMTGPACEVTP